MYARTCEGRAPRKELWMFVLFSFPALIVLGLLIRVFDARPDAVAQNIYHLSFIVFINSFLVVFIIWLFLFKLPAKIIKRLHDTGRNGWWSLLPIITMLAGFRIEFYYPHPAWSILQFSGLIILLVFMCLNSEPNENKYGVHPKADD
jgi:uncharacterized membrane protein YhaH (DUF805 family)